MILAKLNQKSEQNVNLCTDSTQKGWIECTSGVYVYANRSNLDKIGTIRSISPNPFGLYAYGEIWNDQVGVIQIWMDFAKLRDGMQVDQNTLIKFKGDASVDLEGSTIEGISNEIELLKILAGMPLSQIDLDQVVIGLYIKFAYKR